MAKLVIRLTPFPSSQMDFLNYKKLMKAIAACQEVLCYQAQVL